MLTKACSGSMAAETRAEHVPREGRERSIVWRGRRDAYTGRESTLHTKEEDALQIATNAKASTNPFSAVIELPGLGRATSVRLD